LLFHSWFCSYQTGRIFTAKISREVLKIAALAGWDPVAGTDRYHVYYGTDMNKMQLFGSATASELQVRGLVEGTKYFFYIRTANCAGDSAPSNFTSSRTLYRKGGSGALLGCIGPR